MQPPKRVKRLLFGPLHPFLFAAFPVLFLYAHNIPQTSLGDTIFPLLVAESLALLLFGVLYLLRRNAARAALGATAILMLILTYGHVAQFVRGRFHVGSMAAGLGVLLAYAVLFIVVVAGFYRLPSPTRQLSLLLNLTGLLVMLLQIGSAATRTRAVRSRIPSLDERPALGAFVVADSVPAVSDRPDIYYIILDRYAGRSALIDVYGFDNSEFLSALENRGFFIQEKGRCNYARTDMSLSSSLNLCYLNRAAERMRWQALPRALYFWLQDYYVWRFLRSQEYCFVHFGTWWYVTSRNRNADMNVNRMILTEFGMIFYKTTLFYALGTAIGWDSMGDQYYRELHKFDRLAEAWRLPGPKFVFAHFLLPHEGFVFDREGRFQTRMAQSRRPVNLNYVEQLEYTNRRVLGVIDSLLANSPVRPVIVLQADEGPRPGDNFSPTDTVSTLHARYSILHAVLLPSADSLFRGVRTPVNTFRVVFNKLFDGQLRLLPEHSFDYHQGRFRDVTTLLDSCASVVSE